MGTIAKYPDPEIGQKFGRLTYTGEIEYDSKRRKNFWCKCDCGNMLMAPKAHLHRGQMISCGCINRENREKLRVPVLPSGKSLSYAVRKLVDTEMRSIPEKYWRDFASMHEGYALLLEEVRELEHEIFFGEKGSTEEDHKRRVQEEAVQIIAVAARIIQELT